MSFRITWTTYSTQQKLKRSINYQVLGLKNRFARQLPRNSMGTIVESVSLHYSGVCRSDKVYNIELEEVAPNQFNVTGYNGKRGGNLTPRKQNDVPVSFAEAKTLF